MEQVAQSDCEVFISEEIRNLVGQCPELPAVAAPPLCRGVGLGDLHRSLLISRMCCTACCETQLALPYFSMQYLFSLYMFLNYFILLSSQDNFLF